MAKSCHWSEESMSSAEFQFRAWCEANELDPEDTQSSVLYEERFDGDEEATKAEHLRYMMENWPAF